MKIPGRYHVSEHYLDEVMGTLWNTHAVGFSDHPIETYLDRDTDTKVYLESEREFVQRTLADDVSKAGPGIKPPKRGRKRLRHQDNEDTIATAGLAYLSQGAPGIPPRLIAAWIAHIFKTTAQGSIMVFLPSGAQANTLHEVLRVARPLGIDLADETKYTVIRFMGEMDEADEADKLFERVRPGQRRIIICNEVLETAVTIPDVQYVIDTGQTRVSGIWQGDNSTGSPFSAWASKSVVQQRAGRVGRLQSGHYYALFSRCRYEKMPDSK